MNLVVLSGGVGAARLLSGMVQVADPERITAIVNTGDDLELHGLSISPDLDTVTYTLAGATDRERGWGLRNETWTAIDSLARFSNVAPAGSIAGTNWFRLGDQDLATHLYRTQRLAEGATLTEVTGEIVRAWGLALRLLPVTDHRLRTMVSLADGQTVSFQDYFVRLRHSVPVTAVRFDGSDAAQPTTAVRDAIANADRIVIAPSNPIVSIGPILAIARRLLADRRDDTVAVSPLIGGRALKGPADRMLDELGFGSNNAGVAAAYRDVARSLVIDESDAHDAASVEAAGMHAIVAPTLMNSPSARPRLPQGCFKLESFDSVGRSSPMKGSERGAS